MPVYRRAGVHAHIHRSSRHMRFMNLHVLYSRADVYVYMCMCRLAAWMVCCVCMCTCMRMAVWTVCGTVCGRYVHSLRADLYSARACMTALCLCGEGWRLATATHTQTSPFLNIKSTILPVQTTTQH